MVQSLDIPKVSAGIASRIRGENGVQGLQFRKPAEVRWGAYSQSLESEGPDGPSDLCLPKFCRVFGLRLRRIRDSYGRTAITQKGKSSVRLLGPGVE